MKTAILAAALLACGAPPPSTCDKDTTVAIVSLIPLSGNGTSGANAPITVNMKVPNGPWILKCSASALSATAQVTITDQAGRTVAGPTTANNLDVTGIFWVFDPRGDSFSFAAGIGSEPNRNPQPGDILTIAISAAGGVITTTIDPRRGDSGTCY